MRHFSGDCIVGLFFRDQFADCSTRRHSSDTTDVEVEELPSQGEPPPEECPDRI